MASSSKPHLSQSICSPLASANLLKIGPSCGYLLGDFRLRRLSETLDEGVIHLRRLCRPVQIAERVTLVCRGGGPSPDEVRLGGRAHMPDDLVVGCDRFLRALLPAELEPPLHHGQYAAPQPPAGQPGPRPRPLQSASNSASSDPITPTSSRPGASWRTWRRRVAGRPGRADRLPGGQQRRPPRRTSGARTSRWTS